MKVNSWRIRSIAVAVGVMLVSTVGLSVQSQAAHTASKAKLPSARITAAQAAKVAAAKYPGKVVGKVPLENEEGRLQYAVTIRSGKVLREVMVNATSGKIDSVEVTSAAKELAEAKAEKASKHSAASNGKAKGAGSSTRAKKQ